MSRVILPTVFEGLKTFVRRHLLILAMAPVMAFASCSSGGDSGGGGGGGTNGSNPPPPTGAANQFAYVGRAAEADVQAYKLDGDGNLTAIGGPVTVGNFPHHVDVDPAGRFLYVSNHDASFVSGFRINQDGSLAPINPAPGSPVTGTDPTENQPHASVIDPSGQFVYVVAGLTASTLRGYKIDTTPANLGALTFMQGQSFSVGTHGHNVTISPNGQFLYVASEDSGEVYAFKRDPATGSLTAAGKITGLTAADAVTVDSQNKFLYACYTNAVEVMQIAADGSLSKITPVSTFDTFQSGPHSCVLHPNGQVLYVANINANSVSVFRVDPATGALADIQTPQPKTGTDPNFVAIHPNGKFLFTADAVSDQLSRFPINADGTLGTPTAIPAGDGADAIGITRF